MKNKKYYFLSNNIYSTLSGIYSMEEFRALFPEHVMSKITATSLAFTSDFIIENNKTTNKIIKSRLAMFDDINDTAIELLLHFYKNIGTIVYE